MSLNLWNGLNGMVLAVGMVVTLMVAGAAEWHLDLLTADNVAAQEVDGEFVVLPGGGPNGEPTIEFASPVKPGGTIVIDLAEVDLTAYDQLHFDLWMEGAPVDIIATLRGYPDAFRGRRWYAMKRFQALNQWDHVRLDLDLDDDLSRSVFETAEKTLTLAFSRPESEGDSFARARIHNVRLVRSLVKVRTDYREATSLEREDLLRFTYPVHLTNTSGRELTVRVELRPETLHHFKGSLAATEATLAPGEEWTTTATISIGPEYRDLPTGHAERAQVRVVTPGTPDFVAMPIRGYRPVYLYGVVPPRPEKRAVFFTQLEARAARLSEGAIAGIARNLDWQVEMPPREIAPVYEMTCRCPECNALLDVSGLYTYFCRRTPNCPKQMEHVTVGPEDPLLPAMLGLYHAKSAGFGRDMALAWRRTGEARFADKAFGILMAYERMFRDLPMVSAASTGHRSMFQSAVLHERVVLDAFLDTYLLLRDGGYERREELPTIANGLLRETLYNVNLHNYGVSAGQVDFVTHTLKGGMILDHWPFFADAIAGDGGMQRMLDRTFDGDGIGIEGGDYARIAATRIVNLADFLNELGIAVDRDRIEQIRYNSSLFGFLPRPDDFAWRTTVLPHNGFTILVNGEGPTWRRASINWGSSRERGAHDFLTTVFHDQDDAKLLLRTRRIEWGRAQAFFSYQSLAQNIPVVDEGNFRRLRLQQEHLRSDERAAGVIISDNPQLPAYPDARLTRALVLFDGCLLVLDRVRSLAGERRFDFPVYGLTRFAALPGGMAPFTGELGTTPAYRLPKNLQSMPIEGGLTVDWAEGDRRVRLHMLGDDYHAFAGVSLTAWQMDERDFLMFRTSGKAATSSFLYESLHGEQPKVTGFVRVAVLNAQGERASDDQALSYDVSFDDGRTTRIVVSLDGGTYRAGEASVDAETRIAVMTEGSTR